jgi:pyridoxine 4-dehydrogenase
MATSWYGGPPHDIDGAVALLREVVASGVNHIDTADFYSPHVTNQIIRKALRPNPDDPVIVTKVSARRGEDGSWIPAFSREEHSRRLGCSSANFAICAPH